MRKTNRGLVVVALILSLFMPAMETTVVSTAMPTVIADLGGIHAYSWVFTAYILASAIAMPISGKLADLYGRKPVMLVGIVLFLLGSIGSGVAHSMTHLILSRGLQGLGGGAMQPISMTIAGDIFSPVERAKMQGIFGAVWGVAGLVGPLIGGLIIHALSWRWVFFVNIPFGIATALVLAVALHEGVERRHRVLDIAGTLVLGGAVVALLVAGHGMTTWATLPLGIALVGLFIAVERRAREPLLPLEIFRSRVLWVASLGGALLGGALISATTFVPLFVQGVQGGTPTEAGLAIAPLALGWPLASTLGGRLLPKVGYRPLIRFGFLLAALSCFILATTLRPGVSLTVPRLTIGLFGLGLGFSNTTLLIAVQSHVSWAQRGVATASTLLLRTIGGTLAVGAMGGILVHALDRHGVVSDVADKMLARRSGVDAALVREMSAALQDGLTTIFWLIAAFALAALLVGMFFPKLALEPDAPKESTAPSEA